MWGSRSRDPRNWKLLGRIRLGVEPISKALAENTTLTEINTPLADTVYFAGEAHDANRQLGLPGAVLSGFDVVKEMFSHSMLA